MKRLCAALPAALASSGSSSSMVVPRWLSSSSSSPPRVLVLLLLLLSTTTLPTIQALKKEGSGNNNNSNSLKSSTSSSKVVLRVENYRYEANKKSNGRSLQNASDEGLKMVLAQELHEESVASFGDDDGGDDNNNNNATVHAFSSASAAAASSTATSSTSPTTITTTTITYNNPLKRLYNRIWSRLDELDRMIVASTLPLAALTCIIPIVATNDLFWVNQLGDALAVSAQSASNMVYQMSFSMFSFLPAVTATLVSQHYANGDVEGTQDVIGQSVMLAVLATTITSALLFVHPGRFLGAILKDGNPALALSKPFLRIRCLSLLPQVISFVAFSAFRGTMDLQSCVKISMLANALNVALTPLLIHVFKFGLNGSALTALVCDSVTALSYIKLMVERRFLLPEKLFKVPTWKQMAPLLSGTALQARSFAMQITNLLVARKVQSFDSDGVAPAAFALAMQTFFMGSVVIYAMGMATQTLYPTAVANSPDEHRTEFRRVLVQRLLNRGFGLGVAVSLVQCLLAPGILRSTPLETVRQAAIVPIMVVISFQGINGLANVGEGIIIGSGKFALASAILVTASLGYMGMVRLSPQKMGINGVFLCMAAYNLLRLVGILTFLPRVVRDDKPATNNADNVAP